MRQVGELANGVVTGVGISPAVIAQASEAKTWASGERFVPLPFGAFVTSLVEQGVVPLRGREADLEAVCDLTGMGRATCSDLLQRPDPVEETVVQSWISYHQYDHEQALKAANRKLWTQDFPRYVRGSSDRAEKGKPKELHEAPYAISVRSFLDLTRAYEPFMQASESFREASFNKLGTRLESKKIASLPGIVWLLRDEDRDLFEMGMQAMIAQDSQITDEQIKECSHIFTETYFEVEDGRELLRTPGPIERAFYL